MQFAHGDDILQAHFGVSKSFERLRLHFFWPKMHTHLVNFINEFESCQRLKNPTGHLRVRPPDLARPNPTKPWDVISTDVMHLNESAGKHKWVLIMVDNFSKYIEAIAMESVNGQTAGQVLIQQIVCRHGCPTTLICDNATYYVAGKFPKFVKLWELKQHQLQLITQKQMVSPKQKSKH